MGKHKGLIITIFVVILIIILTYFYLKPKAGSPPPAISKYIPKVIGGTLGTTPSSNKPGSATTATPDTTAGDITTIAYGTPLYAGSGGVPVMSVADSPSTILYGVKEGDYIGTFVSLTGNSISILRGEVDSSGVTNYQNRFIDQNNDIIWYV